MSRERVWMMESDERHGEAWAGSDGGVCVLVCVHVCVVKKQQENAGGGI